MKVRQIASPICRMALFCSVPVKVGAAASMGSVSPSLAPTAAAAAVCVPASRKALIPLT